MVPGKIVAADSFAVSDSWALMYRPGELDDCGTSVYTLEPFGDWSP